jgi:hypothetical protein
MLSMLVAPDGSSSVVLLTLVTFFLGSCVTLALATIMLCRGVHLARKN